MHKYDHRMHVGNAGDVWKHFLLLEVADFLLSPDSKLVYAESHIGRPLYNLQAHGEWKGGIGKLWPILPRLMDFCYFDILADLNPHGLKDYPGSVRLMWELSRKKRTKLNVEGWDNDENVQTAWSDCPKN